MKNLFLLIVFIASSGIHAQDVLIEEPIDTSFTHTEQWKGATIGLPATLDSNLDFELLGGQGDFLVSTKLRGGFNRKKMRFIEPLNTRGFEFSEVFKTQRWLNYQQTRYEFGLGLQAIMMSAVSIGIIPYRGGLMTKISYSESQNLADMPIKMPKNLSETESWSPGDSGTYQTFGGLNLYVSGSKLIFKLNASLFIQNQFIVGIKKIDEHSILLSLTEEDLKRKQFIAGALAAKLMISGIKGKRLSAHFELDLRNERHLEMYKSAIGGDLKPLQEFLPEKKQTFEWKGTESSFDLGIPGLLRNKKVNSEYDILADAEEFRIVIRTRKKDGLLRKFIFSPAMVSRNYVFQTKNSIKLVWSRELTKVKRDSLDDNFLRLLRTIGASGFDGDKMDGNTNYGLVLAQSGMTFVKEDADALRNAHLDLLADHLTQRCVEFILPCAQDKARTKILRKLSSLLKKPWDEMKGDFGLLLSDNPALIGSLIKALKLQKKLDFRILSEKFQSIQGSEQIKL